MTDAIALSRQSMLTARDVENMYAQNATEMQDPNSIKKVALYTTDHAHGVQATIVESINESLLVASRLSLNKAAELTIKYETAREIAHKMGSVDDQNSVAHRCINLANQFQRLSKIDRNSLENAKNSTFLELRSFLNNTKEFTNGIQKERALTHEYIREKLDQINDCLQAIHASNLLALASPTSPMAGEIQQRAALNKLSQLINLHARQESDGTCTIYTDISGDQRLVYHDQIGKFSYSDHDITSPQQVFNPITITLNNTTIDATSILTNSSGEISAHLHMQDVFLPALQQQMDNATTALVTQFNTIHNMGTSTVLRATITGDGIPNARFIDGTESLGATTGIVRFALMDTDYKLNAGSGNIAYLDVDLSNFGGGTIDDFVTFLNTSFTTAPNNINIQASIVEGQLTLITPDTQLGIAIGEQDPFAPTPIISNIALNTGEGAAFSAFFGLNNLLSNHLAPHTAGYTQEIKIRPDIENNLGNSIAVGSISMKTPPTTHDALLFGTHIAKQLGSSITEYHNDFSLTATMGSKKSSIQEYFTSIVGNLSVVTKDLAREKEFATTTHLESAKILAKVSKTTHQEVQDGMIDLALFQQMMLRVLSTTLAMRDALFEIR